MIDVILVLSVFCLGLAAVVSPVLTGTANPGLQRIGGLLLLAAMFIGVWITSL